MTKTKTDQTHAQVAEALKARGLSLAFLGRGGRVAVYTFPLQWVIGPAAELLEALDLEKQERARKRKLSKLREGEATPRPAQYAYLEALEKFEPIDGAQVLDALTSLI